MRTPDFYKGKEQTYLKHFFLERYLQTVAFHIGFRYPSFAYVDGFSGPWRAEGENLVDTSFWIALNQLNYVREGLAAQGKHPDIKAVFVEKIPTTFASLEREIEACKGSIDVMPYAGTFEENIPKILQSVKKAFSFFFIDPTGWKGFGMDALKPIFNHSPGEVIINFMYDYINRFLNWEDPKIEATLDTLFGTQQWRSLRDVQDREYAIVDFYREQVRVAGNFQYVTSTRIMKPTQDRAYYHLIYATRNPKGIIEFRAVEKNAVSEQEQVRWSAKRMAREDRSRQAELQLPVFQTSASDLEAERAKQRKRAEERIVTLLKSSTLEDEVIRPRVLEIPLVWNSDFNAIVIEMRNSGKIFIDGLGPRERAPKKRCRFRLA